jgi:hypothetical protein
MNFGYDAGDQMYINTAVRGWVVMSCAGVDAAQ